MIVNNSIITTKPKTLSHLKSLNTKITTKSRNMSMEYPDSVMGQTQLYCSVKLVNGIPTQSLSITGSPTPIQIKKTMKYPFIGSFLLKKTTTVSQK